MFTTGSKWFLGLAGFGVVAALVYGWGSGGGLLGVVTLGLRGSVGELAGITVFVALVAGAAVLAVGALAFRDADARALAEMAHTDVVPAAEAPDRPGYWPLVGAFAVAITVLGLVVGPELVVIGLILASVVAIEWTIRVWSDRATGDPEANRRIRNVLLYPLELPLVGALIAAVVVLGLSRILLSLSKAGSAVFAIVLASLILGIAFVVATRPHFSRTLVVTVLVIGAIGVIVGGIVAAAEGEREFEPHEEEGVEEGLSDAGSVVLSPSGPGL
jgi:hypothetical protein